MLLLGGSLLIRPVTALKPVMTSTGEFAHLPDGKRQMREDKVRTFMANWDAYLIMGLGGACLLWAVSRATGKILKTELRKNSATN